MSKTQQRKGKVDYSTFLKADESSKSALTALQLPKLNTSKKRKAEELDTENIDPQSDAKTAIKKLKKSTSLKELPLQETTNTSRDSSDDEELKAKLTALKTKFKRLKSKYDELLDEKKKQAESKALEAESAAETKKKIKQLEQKIDRVTGELEDARADCAASTKKATKLEKERDQLLAEHKKKDDQESSTLRRQVDELKSQNKKLLAAQQEHESEVQDLKRTLKQVKREHDEQLRAVMASSSQSDDSARVLELWSHVMRVTPEANQSYTCLYKNVQQTHGLMFELTTGLKDNMVQYRPVFSDEDSLEDVEQVTRDTLPDYLRNEIYFKQHTLAVFLTKLFAFMNSKAVHDSHDSE